MLRPSIYHARRNAMELKMTSFIDVVFLLLVFFVWTASFQIAEFALPSTISESKASAGAAASNLPPPPEADFPDVVVRIGWTDGRPAWRVNEEPLPNLQEVRQKLARVFEVNRDAPVIIHPDKRVPLGHVIDVYDVIRLVGFSKVQFAASQEI